MFDPLSALSCIGFTIGVVGFLVTTISKIDEGLDKVRECRDLLLHYNLQLKDGQLQLKAWRSIWIREAQHDDKLYVYLWGKEGFREVQTRLQSLLSLSSCIKTLVRRPTSIDRKNILSSDERMEWHHLLSQQNFETNPQMALDERKLQLSRRIGFSLFGNTTLLDRIGRFKEQVQGLDDFSVRTFRLLRSGDPNSKVSPKEVCELAALKHYIDRASIAGFSAFENSHLVGTSGRTVAELELSPPEEDQALHTWNEQYNLQFDIFIRPFGAQRGKAGRFRIIYKLEAHDLRDRISQLQRIARRHVLEESWINIDPIPPTPPFLQQLESPTSMSKAFRRMLRDGIFTSRDRKSFDVERADLVLGLAHWFIHFWNTPWTNDLCSCNIRQVRLPDFKTRHSLTTKVVDATTHSQCRPIELADKKLTLLGKTLVEVALARPISLDLTGGEIVFVTNCELKTRGDLLTELNHRFGRTTITKAIRYCLDPANAHHQHFGPEHMDPFCQNILQP